MFYVEVKSDQITSSHRRISCRWCPHTASLHTAYFRTCCCKLQWQYDNNRSMNESESALLRHRITAHHSNDSGIIKNDIANNRSPVHDRTRSSATAAKQRVSCACLYLGWLTDRAMHRIPQNRRGCIIFWNSNALIQEVLAENGFWHEIAAQGHSRSFTVQSVTGRQGVAYRHAILLAVSLKFSKRIAT